jgi:hypothetical protein
MMMMLPPSLPDPTDRPVPAVQESVARGLGPLAIEMLTRNRSRWERRALELANGAKPGPFDGFTVPLLALLIASVILLCGDKGTQARDIETAKNLAKDLSK